MSGSVNENELPTGWQTATFDDLVDRGEYGTSVKCNYTSGGTPVLRIPNIAAGRIVLDDLKFATDAVGYDDGDYLQPGDLLVCRTNGSVNLIGRAALVRTPLPAPTAFASYLLRFRLREPLTLPLWVDLFFNSRQARSFIESHAASSAGQHNISLSLMRTMTVPIPPLREQRRIVAKVEELFSELDAGVAALERVRTNLKRYRASVLKAAVEGRLTADWRAAHPNAEPASELLARILADRRKKWEADQLAKFAAAGKSPPKDWQAKYAAPAPPDMTNLPKLPMGWAWANIQQIGSVQLGRQRSPQHHNGSHMRPYLRVANVFEDRIDTRDVMEMNFTPDEFETYRLSFGDILLNEGQSLELVGRPAMYRDEVPGACFTNTLVRFRPFDGVDPHFALKVFLAYLKNGRFQKIASITVNIAHLGAGRFSEIEFPLPPLVEQEQIVMEVESRLSVTAAVERQVEADLKRAARLRQTILKRAFAGKLVPQDPNDEPASALLARIRGDVSEPARKPSPSVEKPSPATVEETPPKKRAGGIRFRQGALAAYIVESLHANESFGRTQLEKVFALAQAHVGVEMELDFKRLEAGPFDEAIIKVESLAKKQGWFTTHKRAKHGYRYTPGPSIAGRCQAAVAILGDKQAAMDKLLEHIGKMDTEQAELFATIYFAWNDLLIDGRPADDAALIAEVHGWNPSKLRFTPERIGACVAWMRQHGYVPAGKGHRSALPRT